jgi:hypothetical protein
MDWNLTNASYENVTFWNDTETNTSNPTMIPSGNPTISPTSNPTYAPTYKPSATPTAQPSANEGFLQTSYNPEDFGTYIVLIILSVIVLLLGLAAIRKIHIANQGNLQVESARIKGPTRRVGRSAARFALSNKLKESNGKFQPLPDIDEDDDDLAL